MFAWFRRRPPVADPPDPVTATIALCQEVSDAEDAKGPPSDEVKLPPDALLPAAARPERRPGWAAPGEPGYEAQQAMLTAVQVTSPEFGVDHYGGAISHDVGTIDHIRRVIRTRSLFGAIANGLDYVPAALPPGLHDLYRLALRHLDDATRAELYGQGGMAAVRAGALVRLWDELLALTRLGRLRRRLERGRLGGLVRRWRPAWVGNPI